MKIMMKKVQKKMKNSVDKGEKGCYIMQAVAWDTRRKTWAEATELLQNRIEQNSENEIRKTKFEKLEKSSWQTELSVI